MILFVTGRFLSEISNEWFFVGFGLWVWEEFGFEATMVRIRVFSDVIVLPGDFRRMLGTNSNFFNEI